MRKPRRHIPSGLSVHPRRWGHLLCSQSSPEHVRMPHYTFHFHGKKSVAHFFDDTFPNDQEATRYAEAMSAKFRTDMPNMCEGGYIAMTSDDGREVTRVILSAIH